MRRGSLLFLAVAAPALASCFEGEFLEGTRCDSSDECAPSYLCIFPTDLEVLRGADPDEGVCGLPEDEFVPADPAYPRRDPEFGCPEGTNASDPRCLPLCSREAFDIANACPAPRTGTATASCVRNEDLIGVPCGDLGQPAVGQVCPTPPDDTPDNTDDDPPPSFCYAVSATEAFCFQSFGCELLCANGQICPDAMGCGENGTCVFP